MLRLPILVFSLMLGAGLIQPDRTVELRAKFIKETNPVKKAKIVPQLADAEYLQVQEQLKSDNAAEAAVILKQMAEEAEASRDALDGKVKDPESHPDGYRQLEISVRQSLRRIDDILPSLTSDEQKPFREARDTFSDVDQSLLHALFPKQSDASAPAAAPTP
jgi:hypothetical protein